MDTMNQPTTDLSNFNSILTLIKTAKDRILKTVNTEIIDLYWQIGKEVNEKTNNGGLKKAIGSYSTLLLQSAPLLKDKNDII
jgi:hypothetical protein